MKTILGILIMALAVNYTFAQESKSETIKNFVNTAIQLAEVDPGTPIASFNSQAKEKAAKVIVLSKENMKKSMDEAAKFTNCYITVGFHTIVHVSDLQKSRQSGAWATKMPYGEGYVQKGGVLTKKEDYINNIIGIPDGQIRTMYLFN